MKKIYILSKEQEKMKSKMNIKSIVIMAAVSIASLFFIHMSLAANTGKVSVETANLRETAEENSKILELLSMNQEVDIIEKAGDWYKVKVKGITGYLRQDLIQVNGEEETNTTSENEEAKKEEGKEEENKQEENQEQPEEQTPEASEENKEEQPMEEAEIVIELGKQKIAEDTKLKIIPVINATNTIEVKKSEEVNVIELMNGWVCV